MDTLRVIIFGAGGVVGQNMIHNSPKNIEAIYTRTCDDDNYTKFIYGEDDVSDFLNFYNPDVILNLAGENRVDIVESTPDEFKDLNENFPIELAAWCKEKDKFLIQGSTQAVFSGRFAPYSPYSITDPINEYGVQKSNSEKNVLKIKNSMITRLTFVLGSRYFREIGRRNPYEDILEKPHQLQVDDRFFSPLFAHDAAKTLWNLICLNKSNSRKIVHLGHPLKCSRFSIASDVKYHLHGSLDVKISGVSHEYFPGLAQRPYDTTWNASDCMYNDSYESNLLESFIIWRRINDEYRR